MHRCALVAKQQSRTHMVGKCELYKGEWDVSEEEMRKIDECGMEKFGTLENDSYPRRQMVTTDGETERA